MTWMPKVSHAAPDQDDAAASSEEAAAEAALAEAAEKSAPAAQTEDQTVVRSAPIRRPAKLDALLAADVESARRAILDVAPQEQVGEHIGCTAEGDRLVLHRFEAKLPGYPGWRWFATLARVPRGKEATVCEVGLLPSEGSLLAPEWVPWAERVRPEDIAAVEAAAEETPAEVGAAVEEAPVEEAATVDEDSPNA